MSGQLKIYLNQSRGFSLAELLILVIVVSVIAIIGVGQYRKMIAKAKQSEAKVLLGAIVQAEGVFFAEYGVYGNNLSQMGMTMSNSGNYIAGFNGANTTTCTQIRAVGTTPTFFPSVAIIPGMASTYFVNPTATTYSSLIGLLARTRRICERSTNYRANTDNFAAFASANLKSIANNATCTTNGSPRCDVWSINNLNELNHQQDGTE